MYSFISDRQTVKQELIQLKGERENHITTVRDFHPLTNSQGSDTKAKRTQKIQHHHQTNKQKGPHYTYRTHAQIKNICFSDSCRMYAMIIFMFLKKQQILMK